MIFFFNGDGDLFRSIPENVYQGSNKHNKLYVIAPFSQSSVVTVGFTLPNGKKTLPSLCALTPATGELAGYVESASNAALYVWALDIPAWVTDYAGNVTAQFYITNSESQIATSSVQFAVLQGVEPSEPTTEDLESVLAAFSSLLLAWQNYQIRISRVVNNYYENHLLVGVVYASANQTVTFFNSLTIPPASFINLRSIDWGDGTINTEQSHTYTEAGEYVISVDADDWGWVVCYGMSTLKQIYIPIHFTKIYASAFEGCANLKIAYIPDNITEIRYTAFLGCTSLKTVKIYNNGITFSEKNLVGGVFTGCTSLEKVYFYGLKTEWESATTGKDIFYGLVNLPTVYFWSAGNESDIDTVKSYIPLGTTESNQLVNESEMESAIGNAVEDGTLTIQQNGATAGTFGANSAQNVTINITKGGIGLGSVENQPMDNTPTENSEHYVKSGGVYTAIKTAVSRVYKFAGSKTVAELNALTVTANMDGYVYNVTDDGTLTVGSLAVIAGDNVVIQWDSVNNTYAWDKLAGTIDLSGYYNKQEVDSLLDGKIDKSATYFVSDAFFNSLY